MYFLSLESVADIARKILYKDILDDYWCLNYTIFVTVWQACFLLNKSLKILECPLKCLYKYNFYRKSILNTKSSNADGYDVVLGTSTKKVSGETRPVEYGTLVKKNIKGNTVTATFKNVKKGTYYAGLHAFNRTAEDGKKVFGQWSNVKKVTVK